MESFFFPAELIPRNCGSKETKNQRGNVLRLIQIRLATPSLKKIPTACQANSLQGVDRCFEFEERSQVFIRADNKASRILTLCGHNPKLSSVAYPYLRHSLKSNRLF